MTQAAVQTPTRFRVGKWGALGILMVLAFLNYMDRNLSYPLLGLIERDLGLSKTQLGLLSTGFHVVYAFSAPLIGTISDRVVRKTVLLCSLVAWSIITALSGTAMGFVSLLVWRSLTGMGEGGYFPTAVSLIGDLFESNRRGLAIALHGLCATLGGSAGYAVGGILGQRLGWRLPFMLAIVPGLVLALFLHRFFDEPPRGAKKESATVPVTAERRPWLSIVFSTPVLLISASACLASFATAGINGFFPIYLHEDRGLSIERAGILTGTFFAVTLVGQLIGGVLSDRLVSRLRGVRPLFVALPYFCAAPALVVSAHGGSVAVITLAYGIVQLFRGFAEPNIYGTVIEATPAHERGTAQGFLLMLSFAGASAAGAGLGWMIGVYRYRVSFDMLALSSLLSSLVALVLFFYVRRRAAA